jgi:hypothetical protein
MQNLNSYAVTIGSALPPDDEDLQSGTNLCAPNETSCECTRQRR